MGSATARLAAVCTGEGGGSTAAGCEAERDPTRSTFFSAFKSMPHFWATMTEANEAEKKQHRHETHGRR